MNPSPPPDLGSRPRRAGHTLSRLVSALAVLKLAGHLATAGNYPLHRDELYYLLCGRHPAWGYPDHPPLTPLLSSVSEHLFGLSLWGLRIWPALAGAAVVYLAGWLAWRFGGGRLAQGLAAGALALAPVYVVSGSLMQTVGLDQFFWTASAAVLAAVLSGGRPRLLLLCGLLLGVGIWAKLTVLAWGCGLLVGLLLTRDRRWLANRWLGLGALIAAACAVPVALWQFNHSWPLLDFMAANRADDPVSPASFLLAQIGMSGPLVGTVLLGAGFVFLLRAEAGRPWRSLGLAVALVWILFLVTGGKAYYAGSTYPLLYAGGAVLLERLLARRPTRTWRTVTVVLLVSQIWMLPAFLPIIPARHLGSVVDKLPHDDWVNMFGWQEVAAQLATVHASLSPSEQTGLRILAPNYGLAGAVDAYGPALGLPAAISGHNGYTFWETAPALDPLLVIGYDPDWLRQIYTEVRAEGTVVGTDLGPSDEIGLGIFYCRGLRLAPAELWTDLRHFD